MRIQCDYCAQYYDDLSEQCPHCGAPNPSLRRRADGVPHTLAELKEYCARNGFTPERTRFFIGQNYKGAKAFGIYQDEAGDFVVYKNKADGSRAVRYKGKDEEYAVSEIYTRLKEEILNQKTHNIARKNIASEKQIERKKKRARRSIIRTAVIAGVVVIAFTALSGKYKTGYYHYGGSHYYNQSDDWYLWDDISNSWVPSYDTPYELTDDADSYYDSSDYSYSSDYDDFEYSDYYSDWDSDYDSDSDSSWSSYDDDDDWDWGSDDWDYGDTDWDSDW